MRDICLIRGRDIAEHSGGLLHYRPLLLLGFLCVRHTLPAQAGFLVFRVTGDLHLGVLDVALQLALVLLKLTDRLQELK